MLSGEILYDEVAKCYNLDMNKEIEATFLNIDKDEYRTTLKQEGAKLIQAETLMRRSVFDTGPHSFLRVRDEGRRIVITYKNIKEQSLTGVDEINLEVDSYSGAVALLEAAGLRLKSRQETLREEWELDGAEITIDTWPALPAYTEIEGSNSEIVNKVAEQLGFSMNEAHYGSVDQIYHHYYGVNQKDVNYCPEIILGKTPSFLDGLELIV